MGDAYMNTDQYEKGIDCYRKAFELAEELGDKEEVGKAYTTNGNIYNNTRQFDKAIECFRKALEIAEKLDDKALLGITYRNMGNAYNNTGQYDKAIDCYRKGLEIAEELGGKEAVGKTYSNIGSAYMSTDQYGKAIDCYRKALEIPKELGDKEEVGRTYSILGIAYNNTRQYEKAIECYRKVLEIREELGDKGVVGRTYSILGNAYNNNFQFDKAIDCYRKALEISKELGDKEEVGTTYSGMGGAYNNSSQYDKAIACYRKALEIAEKMGDKKEVERIYSNMGAVYNNIAQNESVTAVARGKAGQIGLQKESQEFEKHGNVESGLIKDANIEEGSQSASGDTAGLGESENERDASVQPSPNRSGFCEENSKHTGEESTVSGTTVSAGSAMNSTSEKVIAKVVDDYDAEHEDEISLKIGELVEVLDQTDTDWWKGSLNGKVGLFPSSYLEKSSISIPKSEPAPVTIAPPANQEPEPSSQLMWIKNSETHREKFQNMLKYAQNHPENIKNINGVRACFENEFLIGYGADGTRVYIGLAEDGYEKAVKRIIKSGHPATLAETEKKILNCPNIVNSNRVVNYWYYDEQSDNNFAFLILGLHEETLKDFVKAQSQEILTTNAPVITRQILEGLNDLHGTMKPILHRDLKPSNILRNVQGDWILADFGISRVLPEGQTTHQSEESGTTFWRAVESYPPENNNDKSDNESTTSDNESIKSDNKSTKSVNKGRYKKQSDIQAAGMVSFYISTKGEHPFGSEIDCVRNLLGGNPVGLDNLADPVAKDLISWMLQHDPKDRPYAHEALKHPYLQSPDEQFELLKCVGNEIEIKAGGANCDVANEINTDPLLSTLGWKSQINVDVMRYVCGKRPYRDKWTQCLRFIRNTAMHWKDQAPSPTVQNEVGEPQDYFLKLFPTLAVVVHRVIRNKEDWKKRKDLKKFF